MTPLAILSFVLKLIVKYTGTGTPVSDPGSQSQGLKEARKDMSEQIHVFALPRE